MKHEHPQQFELALNERNFHSGKVSESAKYIAFGLIAVAMSLLTSTSELSNFVNASFKGPLAVAVCLATFSVLMDHLHYVLGYTSSEYAVRNKQGNYEFKANSWSYRLTTKLFWFKQILTGFACVIFIYVLAAFAFNPI